MIIETASIRKSGNSISVTVNKGDIIKVGRFKNKKIEAKKFSIDDKGQPRVNGRTMLNFRIDTTGEITMEKKSILEKKLLKWIARTTADDFKGVVMESLIKTSANKIIDKLMNKIIFFFSKLGYKLRVIFHPIKGTKNFLTVLFNMLNIMITSDSTMKVFGRDMEDMDRKVEVGEIKDYTQWMNEYNKIMEKHGFDTYEVWCLMEQSVGEVGGIDHQSKSGPDIIFDEMQRHYGDATGASQKSDVVHLAYAMQWLYENDLLTKYGYEAYKNEVKTLGNSDSFKITSKMLKPTANRIFLKHYDKWVADIKYGEKPKFDIFSKALKESNMEDKYSGTIIENMNKAVNWILLGNGYKKSIQSLEDRNYYNKLKANLISNMVDFYKVNKISCNTQYSLMHLKQYFTKVLESGNVEKYLKRKLLIERKANNVNKKNFNKFIKKYIKAILLDSLFFGLYVNEESNVGLYINETEEKKVLNSVYSDTYKTFKKLLIFETSSEALEEGEDKMFKIPVIDDLDDAADKIKGEESVIKEEDVYVDKNGKRRDEFPNREIIDESSSKRGPGGNKPDGKGTKGAGKGLGPGKGKEDGKGLKASKKAPKKGSKEAKEKMAAMRAKSGKGKKGIDLKKSDLNKDGKLSSYEATRGVAIAKSKEKGKKTITEQKKPSDSLGGLKAKNAKSGTQRYAGKIGKEKRAQRRANRAAPSNELTAAETARVKKKAAEVRKARAKKIEAKKIEANKAKKQVMETSLSKADKAKLKKLKSRNATGSRKPKMDPKGAATGVLGTKRERKKNPIYKKVKPATTDKENAYIKKKAAEVRKARAKAQASQKKQILALIKKLNLRDETVDKFKKLDLDQQIDLCKKIVLENARK